MHSQRLTRIIVNRALARCLAVPYNTLSFERTETTGDSELKTCVSGVTAKPFISPGSINLHLVTTGQAYQVRFIASGDLR
jgi:hypothetical protein